ncbi:MAG: VOC family protein [Alphaproteobacteria bacterium]
MGLRFMEHFLILTDDPAGTRDWWCKALGFSEGPHPEFGFPVHWLYIGEQDVVHIGKKSYSKHQDSYLDAPGRKAAPGAGSGGTGAIDHVCFNCTGIDDFVGRLEAAGVHFNERQAHNQALYQLFFVEPINDIKVELNFAASEAEKAGRQPTRTAADSAKEKATT